MPEALIIAHGAPSNPAPQQARMHALAEAVAAYLPGWLVRGATLAAPGALAGALQGLTAPLVYPFFMAEGWFTRTALPRALASEGVTARQLAPFGLDADLPDLVRDAAIQAALFARIDPRSATLLLAAHGSKVSPASRLGADAMARQLAPVFAQVRLGLIEEPPFLADAARITGPALCLPLFALRAGHVETDIPEALARAVFSGPVLLPIGEHPRVAQLIAAALARA